VDTDANVALVREFFNRLYGTHQTREAFELLGDGYTWWLPGKLPISGSGDKQSQLEAELAGIAAFEESPQYRITGVTAQDDRVAVEMELQGRLKNGFAYDQRYHYLIEVRDGKIATMRVYLDTDHMREVYESFQ
jgi:ketosteroid isomerase-like protein